MPLLRTLLSSLTLGKAHNDEEIPQDGAQSPLRRSNAVLRKKNKSKQSDVDLNLNLSLLDENDEGHERLFHDLQDFEDEVQAIADLRGQARSSLIVKHQQHDGDEDLWGDAIRDDRVKRRGGSLLSDLPEDFWSDAILNARPKARRDAIHVDVSQNASVEHVARSSYQQLDPMYAIRDPMNEEKLRKSHRYLEPLEAIREGRKQQLRYSSPNEILSVSRAESECRHPFDEQQVVNAEQFVRSRSTASLIHGLEQPLRIHANPGRSRREMWVHSANVSSPSLGAAEDDGSLRTFYHTANSRHEHSAYTTAVDEHDVLVRGRGKRKTKQRSGEQVDEWLSAQESLYNDDAAGNFDVVEKSRMRSSKNVSLGDGLASLLAGEEISDALLKMASQTASPPHRDCIVCGDSKIPLDFPAKPPTTACEHKPQTCTDCLQSWMTSEVETKGTSSINCPECPQTLSYTDIKRAASPTTFATYDKLTIRAALGALPDFSFCLSPTCTSGQENPHSANFMDCHACGYKQCLSHRVPWHVDETCAEYDYRTSGQKMRDEEQKTEAMLDSVSKKCPNPKGCGWRIQKVDGCDHMTCRRCRWEFCWECGASQKEIRKKGNEAHDGACKYHSKNLEVAWPFNAH